MAEVKLRAATEADRPFFREVYAGTRAAELALLPWDDATKAAFVDHQFTAQSAHYDKYYADATVDVVTVDGRDAGRLIVFRGAEEIRVVDVALLAEFRGSGAGTRLLAELQEEARASGRTLSIHVEKGSRARALYDRMGFVEAGEAGAHHFMVWTPDGQPKTAS